MKQLIQAIQNLLKYRRLQRAFTKYLRQADKIDRTPSTKTDPRGAYLWEIYLRGADLRGADLREADEIDRTPSTKFDRQIILIAVLAYIAMC